VLRLEPSLATASNTAITHAGSFEQGGRVGLLLDLGGGSLRFFKNGVQNGPGYGAGCVTGAVVAALQMYNPNDSNQNKSVRLLPNAQQPE
jgi:hypothetical protein